MKKIRMFFWGLGWTLIASPVWAGVSFVPGEMLVKLKKGMEKTFGSDKSLSILSQEKLGKTDWVLVKTANKSDLLSQIESLKGWKITIRNHPILPIEKCEKYLNVKFDSFPNISISKNTSLHDDIKNCAIILYWGTTVSLEALAMGRPIIHYHQGDLVNYDPVFELSTFKEVICRNDPLLPILNKYLNLSDTEYLEKSKIAIDYVNQYFYPVNKETIKKFTAL